MSLFELVVIASLATYRLTSLFSDEQGPFDIFTKFRHWAGVRYDEHSRKIALNAFAEGLICFYCCSVWIGGFVTAFLAIASLLGYPMIAIFLLLPFCLSGLAVFMKKWAG